jgi:hypothetical protein
MKMIPAVNCKDGYLYIIRARNAKLGIYEAETKSFKIRRKKGNVFIDREIHWQEDDTFGTAKPFIEIEKVPEDAVLLDYLKGKENELQEEISETLIRMVKDPRRGEG